MLREQRAVASVIFPAVASKYDPPLICLQCSSRVTHRLQIELFQNRVELYFLNFFWFDQWTSFSDVPPCQLLKLVPFSLWGCFCSWFLHRRFVGDSLVRQSRVELRHESFEGSSRGRFFISSFALARSSRRRLLRASISVMLEAFC